VTRKQSFRGDERAIEGLPIRLVIALVVGVASLAIMMQLLGGIGTIGNTEVNVNYDGSGSSGVVNLDYTSSSSPSEDIQMNVVTSEGESVNGDTTVVITGGSLEVTNPITATLPSGSGSVTISDSNVDWRTDQQKGTLKVELKPPGDGSYVDDKENREILVTRST